MRKKKIVFHSDFSLAKTGFGRNTRAVLSYLYKTGKYDIVNYCCHVVDALPDLSRTPWKSLGAMPHNENEVNTALKGLEGGERERASRSMWYGAYNLDKTIFNEKPDVYFGVQDIWGVDYSIDKPWFSKITSVIWTTLDSLPLLPHAVEKAPAIKNYWMWSSFATEEMHRLGHKHVKTFHGPIDDSFFFPYSVDAKVKLRKRFNIDQNRYLIGFVFRNQIRKSIPNLMAGYSMWKKSNPNVKSGLLLHTCFSEGWNIMDLAKQNEVPAEDIFTTYICRHCRSYSVKPFCGEAQPCQACGQGKSVFTTSLGAGITEEELNEVYNLMDVYCHPFTSGGQEIPIQEAKLAGLITLVTDYSCGSEMCMEGACSLPLQWEPYREFETQFIKATTLKESICQQIDRVYKMSDSEKNKLSIGAREWAIENYSIKKLGAALEAFLDSCPMVDWDDKLFKIELKNPEAQFQEPKDDVEYILALYRNILKMNVGPDDSGVKHWIHQLSQGVARNIIDNYFRETAKKENEKILASSTEEKIAPSGIERFLDKEDEGKRLLYVMPNGIGDVILSTSLFKSIKEQYPEYNLYVATEPCNFDTLLGNPHVYKVIPYSQKCDNLLYLEGIDKHKGFFEIAFLPHITTQRMLTYLHNGKTRIAYSDLTEK